VLRKIAVAALILVSGVVLVASHSSAQTTSDTGRKVVSRIAPQYPTMARSLNIQGSVKAEVLVAPNGTAKSIEIKGGHPLLAQSAQDALREWKWEPAPRETHETVELKFSL
jgi:TonB family protein